MGLFWDLLTKTEPTLEGSPWQLPLCFASDFLLFYCKSLTKELRDSSGISLVFIMYHLSSFSSTFLAFVGRSGPEEVFFTVLPVLLLGLLAMFLFSRLRGGIRGSQVIRGGLNKFDVAEFSADGEVPSGNLVSVEGRRLGILAKLLEMMNLQDPTFAFEIDKDFIGVSRGRKFYDLYPTKEIHSVTVGYNKEKMWLVLALLLFGIFFLAFLEALFSGASIGTGLLLCFLGVLFGGLCMLKYKLSEALEIAVTCVCEDRVRMRQGVRLQSSLTGTTVTQEQFETAHSYMRYICQLRSRFYD